MQVNADLWAKNLNVVTGANQVDYATLAATTLAGTGAAPTVSIDVAALGGMYANKIRLVGTEAGVGVANAGKAHGRRRATSASTAPAASEHRYLQRRRQTPTLPPPA